MIKSEPRKVIMPVKSVYQASEIDAILKRKDWDSFLPETQKIMYVIEWLGLSKTKNKWI